ncbi:phosphotransferase family protein [Sinosporangium siamense]|uniref:Aminoglycoside phosphotransferase domain-containing protein n=1 Tax=Sinosporangium siamense TaxID=1367973 RepID=A0A919RMA5_9ACTN|nr:phosphotransferase [Sinosporangium siamense]GII94599.1 hypothetical protein Ssi02_48300 [Sinosporangium siamense]
MTGADPHEQAELTERAPLLQSIEIPDEDELARQMAAQLADVLPAGSRVSAWRRGADYAALRVETGAGERLVLRVPLREIAPSAYDGTVDFGAVLEREAAAHRVLAEAGVPMAPLRGWRRADGAGRRSWMLLGFVDNDGAADLNDAQLERLGGVLRRIHEIDPPGSAQAAVGAECRPDQMIRRVETRVSALASRADVKDHRTLVEAATAVIAERAVSAPLRLLHMDLRQENLCYRGDELAAVIDLSNCTMGDPAAELGRMQAYGLLKPPLLAGYRGIDTPLPPDDVVAAYAADTYALLGLLGTDEFADRELVERGTAGLNWCRKVLCR